MEGRIVGISHRRKKTADGEARPTMVHIVGQGSYALGTEQDELDWVYKSFPVQFRECVPEDDLSQFRQHQIVWRKLKTEENPENFPQNLVRKSGRTSWELAIKVPAEFDGFRQGDRVAMILGGSGDILAEALSRRGRIVDAQVLRIPPFRLKDERDKKSEKKDADAKLLAEMLQRDPDHFYPVNPKDENIIRITLNWRRRSMAMRDRIACGNRLNGSAVGSAFAHDASVYPTETIEEIRKRIQDSDVNFQMAFEQENTAMKDLIDEIEQSDVYQYVFRPIERMGPAIAARIITNIVDIRRFPTNFKIRKFSRLHVENGQLPVNRRGVRSSGNREIRQAFYLFSDQCVKTKDSVWGQKFRDRKTAYRQKYPKPVPVGNGSKLMKYTDGHIHNMARWPVVTELLDLIFTKWWELEGVQVRSRGNLLYVGKLAEQSVV